MSVPRSLSELQRALGREANDAAGALARLVGRLAARLIAREPATREERLVEATVNRIMGAADAAGRIEVRFGAPAFDPQRAAPPGALAPAAQARKALAGIQAVNAKVAALEPQPGRTPRAAAASSPVPRVQFFDALSDLETRDPIGAEALRRIGLDVSAAYAPVETPEGPRYPHGFAAARAATAETAEAVRRDLAAGFREGTPTAEVAERIAKKWDWPESYARTVARTNYATSTSAGRFAEADRAAADGVRVGFRFETAGDSDVRDGHEALDGLVASIGDPIWEEWTPPLGFNCFPGGTLVQGRALAVSRMLYDGEALKILTKAGRRLTLTPNHPVMTVRGLVPAREVNQGDQLLGHLVESDRAPFGPSCDVHEDHGPTSVEQVFRAAAERFPIARLRVGGNDLHGDAAFGDGEVEVVAINGILPLDGNAEDPQCVGEPGVVLGAVGARDDLPEVAGPRRLADVIRRARAAPGRGPRPAALGLDAGAIVRGRLVLVPLEALRLGPAARLDASLQEATADGRAGYANLVRQLLLGLPGEVSADEVVRVERDTIRAHVYDLQTETGWIVANNIFISNCRCVAVPIVGDDVPRGRAYVPAGAQKTPGFGSRPRVRAAGAVYL